MCVCIYIYMYIYDVNTKQGIRSLVDVSSTAGIDRHLKT